MTYELERRMRDTYRHATIITGFDDLLRPSEPTRSAPAVALLAQLRIAPNRRGIHRTLVIFPGALGDLICAIPAIRAFGRRHPNVALELMARTELARFAVGRMGIVRGHSIDRREVGELFTVDGWARAAEFFGQFDEIHSFFAHDVAQFRESLEGLSGGDVLFYPFRPPGEGHVTEGYLRSIGEYDLAAPDPRIEVLPEDSDAAHRMLHSLSLTERNFVLIFPGSGSAKKNWPAQGFYELAQRITMPVLFVLGPAESGLEPALTRRELRTISELELGEVAGLAKAARFFIGNDSGVSHLAAAVGTPGLTIFGPTDPVRWRPLGPVRVIKSDPLEKLTVDQVAAAIRHAGFQG